MSSVAELSERLLCVGSATRELERCCKQHGAIRQTDVVGERLDDDSLDALNDHRAAQPATFRRAQLAIAGIAVVEALNWYFPTNLTAEIREQLLTTDIPLGHVIAPLRPRRRTFFVLHSASTRQADLQQGANRSSFVFEHRAIVYAVDALPLAIVHERFLSTLFNPAAAMSGAV
jgi:chorismate-pyruvate lyase